MNSSKRRLLFFCFYDSKGIVSRYVQYYLESIQSEITKCIIAVNGRVNEEGYKILKKYSSEIVIRKNKGFDAAAHKELIEIVGVDEIRQYDELILANDTCYGPFIPFKEIFGKMDTKECDFWGINAQDEGDCQYIESYFIVFRKSILADDSLYKYMAQNIITESDDVRDAWNFFELGISSMLYRRGYKYEALCGLNNCDALASSNHRIKKYGFPMLKRKVLEKTYVEVPRIFGNTMDALKTIMNLQYNIDLILEHANSNYDFRLTKEDIKSSNYPIDSERQHWEPMINLDTQIREFCKKKDAIFIYGTGYYAKRTFVVYGELLDKVSGYVVSDEQHCEKMFLGKTVRKFSELNNENIGLIVAMDLNNSNVVRNKIQQKNNMEALYLWKEMYR